MGERTAVWVCLKPADKEELRTFADERGLKLSTAARMLLKEGMARHGRTPLGAKE